MQETAEQRELLEKLAEEFVRRYRNGERPSMAEYVDAHPQYAAEIKDLFPALVMMEELAPSDDSVAGPVGLSSLVPTAARNEARRRIGDYTLLREIGRGGMGVVYEAEQLSLGRRVALKVLTLPPGDSNTVLERFRREARAAAQLHHTNIVPVHEVGQEGDHYYYAMQLIAGQGLDEVVKELRQLRAASGTAARPISEPGSVALSLLTARFEAPNLAEGGGQQSAVGNQRSAAREKNTATLVPGAPSSAMLLRRGPAEPGPCKSGLESTPPSKLHRVKDPTAVLSLSSGSDVSLSNADSRRYYWSVAKIGVQAAEALAYAHQRGVIHRDVKPSNLLLDTAGVVWVTDFGLAKTEDAGLTQTGDIVGTVRYMAPERFRGSCDRRADVYGLGLTLYELLTLTPAFDGADRLVLIDQIGRQEPKRPRALDPRIPRDLETVVLKAIEKEPGRRYQTAEELADDLRCLLEDRPIRARRSSSRERFWRWCRRNPVVAGLLTLVVFLLSALAGVSLLSAIHLNQALDQTLNAERDAQQDRDRALKTEEQGRLELAKSLLAQGKANQRTGLAGQRFASLDLLGLAATIFRAHPQGGQYLPETRDQAIAALGLSDFRIQWQRSLGAGWCIACDAQLKRYAALDLFGSREVVVRRMEDDRELLRLPRLEAPFWFVDLRFSADGQYLAAGYRERARAQSLLRVWRLANKELIFSQAGLGEAHCSWSFRPDRARLVFCHRKGDLVIWDLESDREVKRLPVHRTPVSIRPANDGKRVAVNFGRQVKVLHLETGGELSTWNMPVDTGEIAWSSDDRLLAIGSGGGRVYIWDVRAGQAASVLHGHTSLVTRCEFGHQGYLLATCSWDGTTRLWDAASGQALASASGALYGSFSPDDRRLPFYDSAKIGVWEVAHGRQCRMLHPGMVGNRTEQTRIPVVEGADFSPDGRLLAVASREGVRLYDIEKGLELAHLPAGGCGCALFHPDGKSLITCGDAGLYRWPIRLGVLGRSEVRRLGPPEDLRANPSGWSRAAWLPGYRSLAVVDGANARVLLVDLARASPGGGRLDALPSESRGMTSIAVSPNGQWAASGGYRDRGIQVWNLPDRKPERLLPHSDGKGDQASFVAFSPDGKWLVSFTENDEAGGYYFWRTGTWERGLVIRCPGTGRRPPVFSRDGRLLALGISPQQIRLADPASGRTIAHLSMLEPVSAAPLAFSADGTRLAAVTNQGTVLLWDLRGVQTELAKRHLDWDAPPLPSVARGVDARPRAATPLSIHVELGDVLPRAQAAWLVRQADQHVRAKEHAKALAALRQAVKIAPDCALAHNNLAWQLLTGPKDLRDPAQALPLARKAVTLEPKQALYVNTLGVALYRTGQFAEAVPVLEQSLREQKGQADAYDLFFLSMCHHRLGGAAKAKDCLERGKQWFQKHKGKVSPHWVEELTAFQAEADAVLARPPSQGKK